MQTPEKTRATALVPAHISGFFQVCDEAEDPEHQGSRNCGPCLDSGVLTTVELEPASRTSVKVWMNCRRIKKAETSLTVAKRMLDLSEGRLRVKISHKTQLPIGTGYGVSGACALGVALSLSKAMGLHLPRNRIVGIAHVAEIECRTGLGDVGAQALGGLAIGLEPGAPPHGRLERIPTPRDIKVICGSLGPLPTKEFMRDGELVERSKRFGGLALRKLLRKSDPKNFMRVSFEFAEALGLLDDELRALIEAVSGAGPIGASQVMLGRAVFALVKEAELDRARGAFFEFLDPDAITVASICKRGAELLI